MQEYYFEILLLVYIIYSLKKGLKGKQLNNFKTALFILLMLFGVYSAYDGFSGYGELYYFIFVSILALIKGIDLGRRKKIEYTNNTFIVSHDYAYILRWGKYYALKETIHIISITLLSVSLSPWISIYYFFMYITVRVIIVNYRIRQFSL